MAMWGNHIQRVKIVINHNIIELVTNFNPLKAKLNPICHLLALLGAYPILHVSRIRVKYLRYRMSEYKSDLEDKLQTYNKINGSIRRHFGKQMNKETKLRIHNITAKAALKFGSEAWVLKKREEQRLEAAQLKFLRHLL